MKVQKREYTAEFKELAVKQVKSGQTAGVVAKDLGLIEQTLRGDGICLARWAIL